MVNEPHDLLWVPEEVAGPTDRDQPVAVFRQIKEPKSQQLLQHLRMVLTEGKTKNVYLVPAGL
jgi:hypothetical protein